MPGPLNGTSVALGTREDLERLVSRLELKDQDVVLNLADGASQDGVAHILGISQPGVSHRYRQALRCLQHLAREPCDPDLVIPELSAYFPDRYRPAIEHWALGCSSAFSAVPDALGIPRFREWSRGPEWSFAHTLRRRVLRATEWCSPSLRIWAAWRLAMPFRSASENMVTAHAGRPDLWTVLPPFPPGEPRFGRKLTPEQAAWVVRCRALGGALRRIARLAGVSRPTVRRVLAR